MEYERFIDVVSQLPPDTRLSTTKAAESDFPPLVQASLLQVCGLIVEAGLQDEQAVVSEDGRSVRLFVSRWLALKVFLLS